MNKQTLALNINYIFKRFHGNGPIIKWSPKPGSNSNGSGKDHVFIGNPRNYPSAPTSTRSPENTGMDVWLPPTTEQSLQIVQPYFYIKNKLVTQKEWSDALNKL